MKTEVAIFIFIFIFSQLILIMRAQDSYPPNTSPLQDTQNRDNCRYILQGVPGRDGRDGRDGKDGVQGPPGVTTGTGPQGPDGPQGPQGIPGTCPQNCSGTPGSVYVRWGRTTCPSVSELVYSGIAGGRRYSHPGSGVNYLCLPQDPEYDVYQAGVDTLRGYVHAAEYEIPDLFPPYADQNNREVPCAVCSTINRGMDLMIPAKMTCPSGWTKEYHGYLMAGRYNHASPNEFVCVDRNPEVVGSLNFNDDGALFYPVEGRCDGTAELPCTPYINGAELTCVVCSK